MEAMSHTMLSPLRTQHIKLYDNKQLYPNLKNLLGVPVISKQRKTKPHLDLKSYLTNNTIYKYLPDMVEFKSFAFDVNTPISQETEADIER